ncbi:hypothetical protein KL86PLE_100138 [uncultured Pleomorphomonas sp.]|uniref:Uncharacterized protein n=1 Tax=uncultured Pleomorphomonas sp. TaxID=442121 RepID=A0A212L1J9_9HYPH|nr:hypothetical protein KL86PLE_100138 [uncultured Pleomorphomonas sp.]
MFHTEQFQQKREPVLRPKYSI